MLRTTRKTGRSQRPLSEKLRQAIYEIIRSHQLGDDPDPCVVIAKDYGGDENAYLRVMALHHGIVLLD